MWRRQAWRFLTVCLLSAGMMLAFGTSSGMAQSRAHVYLLRGLLNVFSLGMDTLSDELNARGVYGLVRHPMYSAFWLMAIAQALLLPNWIAGLSGLVGFGTLFFGRVGREEEMMMRGFGEEYRTYMARTARVVPWIY